MHLQTEANTSVSHCKGRSRETPCTPSKKKYPDKGKKFLEETTKKRIRLEQEARTQTRREQLDFEACEKLGKVL
jgi:hypothetical protein